jgi:predicted CxxxxCH...CXXCH cytochrome family protein
MTLTRLATLMAVILFGSGCWNYPADVIADSKTRTAPDQTDDGGGVVPDIPFIEDTTSGEDGMAVDMAPMDASEDAGPQKFHPAGWVSPTAHGSAAMLNTMNCTTCHGAELEGGSSGQSCDTCHSDGWRSNCTFCHGGTDNDTGAPPKSVDGATAAADGAFPAHASHVTGDSHAPITCAACHSTPTEATSPGHMFDDTPGAAEVDLSGGLSPAGTFANLTCSSLYCHGNGQGDNGSVPLNKSSIGCASCHPGPESSSIALGKMTGRHAKHLIEDVGCYECHGEVFNDQYGSVDGSLHVNGEPNVKMPDGITYNGSGCTGTCHGEYHMNPGW